LEAKTVRLQDKIARLRQQMRDLDVVRQELKTQPDSQISRTDPDARSMATSAKDSGMVAYNIQVLEAVQRRLESSPESMTIKRSTVEHVFGTLKG
jgi:hypothetical protein